jgi:hypothetical protein
MTVPAVPRGLRSLIPGPGSDAAATHVTAKDTVDFPPAAVGAATAAAEPGVVEPPIAARTRSVLDGLAPVSVPRAVAQASADVLCAMAETAPNELAQVARELAARLRESARTA